MLYAQSSQFYYLSLWKVSWISSDLFCFTSGSRHPWPVRVRVLVAQWRPTPCNPTDCSPPGSSVRGILQTWILEWVAMPSSRQSSWPRNRTQIPGIAGRFSTDWAMRGALTCTGVIILSAGFLAYALSCLPLHLHVAARIILVFFTYSPHCKLSRVLWLL